MPVFEIVRIEELHEIVIIEAEDEDEAREEAARGGGRTQASYSVGFTDPYSWDVKEIED